MTDLERMYLKTGDAPRTLLEARVQMRNRMLERGSEDFILMLLGDVRARLQASLTFSHAHHLRRVP